MTETGIDNPNFGANRFGFRGLSGVNWNLSAPKLYEHALQQHEAHIAEHGPLVADTGVHTGRSPKDKFVVRDANSGPVVWWDNNAAMSVEHFDTLLADFLAHAEGKTLFAQDLFAGADSAFRVRARIFTEYAWHSLFIRNLLIRPPVEDLSTFAPDLTIVEFPLFPADPKRHGTRTETVIARRLHPQDYPHRRLELRWRDEKGGVHLSQLRHAAAERAADALLRQCRARRRHGDFLRPLRDRQDDPLRRCVPHAYRGR